MRVPVCDASAVDLNVELGKTASAEEINAAFKKASESEPLQGYLQYSEEELVSCDIIGNPHSAVFDSLTTSVVGGNLVKVLAWYDNEFGYASRMIDMMKLIAKE